MKDSSVRDLALMALRNLGRHRVKTIITTTAVAISVALYIFIDGWLLGINLESKRNIVSYETGAAKIQTAAYYAKKDELPMYEGFVPSPKLYDKLAAAGYDAAPRFMFGGTLYSRDGSAPMAFNAVDPERDRKLLRYVTYMEAGRFPESGKRELAVGTMAAAKLRVGIPERPTKTEFESEVLGAAKTDEERAFVSALYAESAPEYIPMSAFDTLKTRLNATAEGKKAAAAYKKPNFSDKYQLKAKLSPEASIEAARALAAAGYEFERGLALRKNLPPADRERLWSILSASGRMDVRLSTVIDVKAAPENIRKDKFEKELLPKLSGAARKAVEAAYVRDPVNGDYRLGETDAERVETALRAMLDADFAGAIRHVNQLIDAKVVGVVNSPNPMTNANVGYLPIDSLQDESGMMLEGKVTEIMIRAANADHAALPGKKESPAAIRAALGDELGAGLEVRDWLAYSADYVAAAAGDNLWSRVMILFLFILSFIGIANTMLMAILERTKETGMLRALGMTDSQILLTYVIEAGCIGAIGSAIGIILGCLINLPMVAYGIDYSAMAKEMSGDYGYRIVAFFRSGWNPPVIILSGVAATVLSAAAAILPTLRALKMPVTESLRFE